MLLCCGEALIDMIPSEVADGGFGYVPHSGGAIFNTAIALGRLGQKVQMLTGVSTDLFGQQLEKSLSESNVGTSLSVRSDRPTTMAFVQLSNGHATYTFYDENSAGRMLTEADLPSLPDDVKALYFGGISLAVEPCADAYAALLHREAKTRTIMIDPNIRPGFIRDEAGYRARLNRMIADADIVKVSDEDLDWIDRSEGSLERKAADLLSTGPKLVVVTRGKDGAAAYFADGSSVSVKGSPVAVVDTVGAGDTFNAGFLASLSDQGFIDKAHIASLSKDAAEAALSYGAKVAAVTVSRAGANPPWKSELTA
ncbi:carbohydrate kinase family protein [Roseibium sp.]|uniref:carbohydrate kinase family protein n=1 Tax=Roseibium sp. TaxID=1936156 RepID=UPI003A976DDD